MRFPGLALVLFLNLFWGPFALANSTSTLSGTQAPAKSFEARARAESRRQGWSGYPEAYEDAFLSGAYWGAKQKSRVSCPTEKSAISYDLVAE